MLVARSVAAAFLVENHCQLSMVHKMNALVAVAAAHMKTIDRGVGHNHEMPDEDRHLILVDENADRIPFDTHWEEEEEEEEKPMKYVGHIHDHNRHHVVEIVLHVLSLGSHPYIHNHHHSDQALSQLLGLADHPCSHNHLHHEAVVEVPVHIHRHRKEEDVHIHSHYEVVVVDEHNDCR